MEETNYDRKAPAVVNKGSDSPLEKGDDLEKQPGVITPASSSSNDGGLRNTKTKSYMQKLSLKDKPRPQRMFYRFLLSFRLIGWPVIFYAGFSYGSYLIW